MKRGLNRLPYVFKKGRDKNIFIFAYLHEGAPEEAQRPQVVTCWGGLGEEGLGSRREPLHIDVYIVLILTI